MIGTGKDMTSAKIVADSINEDGDRITSFEVCFPRFILAEMNTHRVFSRNSASSRAIPTSKLVAMVRENPVVPEFGRNQAGMVASEQINASRAAIAARLWKDAAAYNASVAETMAQLKVHKQAVNRILEPFLWHTVLITATTFENFFLLRCAPDAQPEMQKVAFAMRDAYQQSIPVPIPHGGWHIPYGDGIHDDEDARIRSIAQCARLSTVRQHEQRPIEDERAMVESLERSGHWSPFEHIAQSSPGRHANYTGWISERSLREEMRIDEPEQDVKSLGF